MRNFEASMSDSEEGANADEALEGASVDEALEGASVDEALSGANADEAFDHFAFARFITNQECAQAFVSVVDDAWLQGWHESNGGNLSYRLREEERDAYLRYLNKPLGGSAWTPLEVGMPDLAGEFFLVTAAGSHFRTVRRKSSATLGLVELSGAGDAWRIIGGFEGQGGREGAEGGRRGRPDGRPTSEFAAHMAVHATRKRISQGKDRVVYHAHPAQVIALSAVLPPDSRTVSRVLWKSLTESILVIPEGVGVLPWMVPGSQALAQASAALMEKHAAVLWPWHGLCCAAASLEAAFGLVHTIEKAAAIYLCARAASPTLCADGSEGTKPLRAGEDFARAICCDQEPPRAGAALAEAISDDQLRQAAEAFGVRLNETFL